MRRALPTIVATGLVLWGAAAARADAPKKPLRPGDPVVSIPLEDIGFQMPQPRLLLGGATMFSLNFVDNTHLLVTYNSHGLIPRDRDMTPQDEDRMVTAELLELPTGKVLAKTAWHMRDRDQYLWPLSHGLFLLRIKDKLTVLDPLGNLESGKPFREQTFLEIKRRVGYVSVSPGGDLLVIETVPPLRPSADETAAELAASQSGGAGLTLNTLSEPVTEMLFYRLVFTEQEAKPMHLLAQSSGRLTTHGLVRVPATSEGFLDMRKESPQTWLFDFQSHSGKLVELSPYDTTCLPNPYFISRSEFVAFGCHGSDTRPELSEFNMRGEEPWVQVLSGAQVAPFILSAPDAGRFAYSHVQLTGSYYDLQNLSPEDVTGQEITVLQSHDGRSLLKVQASPVQRMGQNFDLSPDGMSFTVIRGGNLEVYKLPALSDKDKQQVKLAEKDTPAKDEARIRLSPVKQGKGAAAEAAGKAPEPPTGPPIVGGGLDLGGVTEGKAPTAPAEPEAPKAPPSLYGPTYPKPTKPE